MPPKKYLTFGEAIGLSRKERRNLSRQNGGVKIPGRQDADHKCNFEDTKVCWKCGRSSPELKAPIPDLPINKET